MNVFEFHAQAMEKAQQLTGACPTFTWDGIDWLAMPNSVHQNTPLTIGGYSFDFALAIYAAVDQFLQAGFADAETVATTMYETPLEYLGQSFKVQSVRVLTGATIIVIGCNSVNQAV